MYQLNHDPLELLTQELNTAIANPPKNQDDLKIHKKKVKQLKTSIQRYESFYQLKKGDTVTNGHELGIITELFFSNGGMPQLWVKWDRGITLCEDPLGIKPEPKLKGLKIGYSININGSYYKIKEFKGNGVVKAETEDKPPLETDQFTPCYWENDGYKFSLLGVRWVYRCNLNNSWIEGIDYPFELDVYSEDAGLFDRPQAYLQDWLHTEGRSHLKKIQESQYKQGELTLCPTSETTTPSEENSISKVSELSDPFLLEDKQEIITPSKPRQRRSKGKGTATIFKTYSNRKKYGNKYPQFYLQVQMGDTKKSVLIPSKKVEDVKVLNAQKIEVLRILDYIGSPKAYEIYLELESYLKKLKK